MFNRFGKSPTQPVGRYETERYRESEVVQMKRLSILGAIGGLLMTTASLSWAAANLNLSKSNINRLIYDDKVMTRTQATAILGDLDKMGQRVVDETTLRGVLRNHGVRTDRIKRVVIEAAKRGRKDGTTIILLENPADEAQARHIAVSDSGVVSTKPPPKK